MVYPQNLACAPKIGTQRVPISSAEYWSGHAVLMSTHNIGFYDELGKIIKYSSSVKSDKVAYDTYYGCLCLESVSQIEFMFLPH